MITPKRDHNLRKRLFVEQSFYHKAKTNLYWLSNLLDSHITPGETVLDPMAGAGSTLISALNGCPTLTGDIEMQWSLVQSQNIQRLQHSLFCAPALACQWTAAKLPLASGSIPFTVTSPPYFDLFSNWNRASGHALDGKYTGPSGQSYGDHPEQIGNIHIYENYLVTMRLVYSEIWRVLRPGGTLIVIVGDKVRNGKVIPVSKDNQALAITQGFTPLHTEIRHSHPSQFRQIHRRRQGENYPLITTETAYIFQKPENPSTRQPLKFALVQAPSPNSTPGQTLFKKQLSYARRVADTVLILDQVGIYADIGSKISHEASYFAIPQQKASLRRDTAGALIRRLVASHGLAAGDEISLHVGLAYAPYLQQRLNSFGARATIPTAHLNLGQKLTWYTNQNLISGRETSCKA